ncbi:hypothetical protein Avbf_18525 [Armadillidium vulgare]|nr:hypothetical protein Avbf_18525 [Armadillidium vulgare]
MGNLYINMLIIDMSFIFVVKDKVLISISQIISNKTKGFKVPVVGAYLTTYCAIISIVGTYSHLSEFLLWGPICRPVYIPEFL